MRSLALSIVLCAGLAHAGEDRAAAKAHYAEGMKHYNLSDYQIAREEFKKAYLAFPESSFLFNVGQCSRMLGEPEEAIKAYRSYLREAGNTPNRTAVEKFISDEEQEIRRRQAERPPTGAEPPKELVAPTPVPTATAPPTTTPPTEPEKVSPLRRWWLWTIVAGVVVVGAAVALAIVFTTPNNAPDPMTTAGIGTVQFH